MLGGIRRPQRRLGSNSVEGLGKEQSGSQLAQRDERVRDGSQIKFGIVGDGRAPFAAMDFTSALAKLAAVWTLCPCPQFRPLRMGRAPPE